MQQCVPSTHPQQPLLHKYDMSMLRPCLDFVMGGGLSTDPASPAWAVRSVCTVYVY